MTEVGLVRFDGAIDYVRVETYPDGSPRVDFPVNEGVQKLLLRPRSLADLFTGLFLADAFRWRGLPIESLILPFVPAARQDRINDSGDYLFTLKSVANVINQREFKHVVMLDPHSMVAPALIENSRVVNITDILIGRGDTHSTLFKGWSGVIAPDAGASKRAFDVAKLLGVPFYQGEKHRDVTTGKLSGFNVSNLDEGRFLVVDDICDGGGTFNGLAESVYSKYAGFDIALDLWVTHGVFSQGTDKLLENFDQILTTDSTTFNKGGATVFPVIERLRRWV